MNILYLNLDDLITFSGLNPSKALKGASKNIKLAENIAKITHLTKMYNAKLFLSGKSSKVFYMKQNELMLSDKVKSEAYSFIRQKLNKLVVQVSCGDKKVDFAKLASYGHKIKIINCQDDCTYKASSNKKELTC